ncbi:MAG: hypothetical protein ACTSPV_12675 [Candidatus Hodarchaeales archaeon]
MSFLKKKFRRSKSKISKVRGEQAKLDIHEKLGQREDALAPEEHKLAVRGRKDISFRGKITLLEKQLNTPETRRAPPNHINVIRRLAKLYAEEGDKGDASYYPKAENLYKQFNVLYPLHMERDDWIEWITASTKARLIREARRLLEEARLLFPGDEKFDELETEVLHISDARGKTEPKEES